MKGEVPQTLVGEAVVWKCRFLFDLLEFNNRYY